MGATNLLWLDIETTGLNPDNREIIQLGMIVTTPSLVEVARFQETVRHSPIPFQAWDKEAWDMHQRTKLVEQYQDAPFNLGEVEVLARSFILKHAGVKPIMSGNSIHFDRGFLREHMPKVLEPLHHRMLDVSFFKVIREIWMVPGGPPTVAAHTALADLEQSIALFRANKAEFFKAGIGPEF